jgi:hypothetical protein
MQLLLLTCEKAPLYIIGSTALDRLQDPNVRRVASGSVVKRETMCRAGNYARMDSRQCAGRHRESFLSVTLISSGCAVSSTCRRQEEVGIHFLLEVVKIARSSRKKEYYHCKAVNYSGAIAQSLFYA